MDEATPSSPQKPNPWTTVTPLSKTIALLLFIALPMITFFIGLNFRSPRVDTTQPTQTVVPTATKQPVSPTPDETSNWKTYTAGSLSIKYPLNWKLDQRESSRDPYEKEIQVTSPLINGQCGVSAQFLITDCTKSTRCNSDHQETDHKDIVATLANGLKIERAYVPPDHKIVYYSLIHGAEVGFKDILDQIQMPDGNQLMAFMGFCLDTTLTSQQQMDHSAFLQGLDVLKSVKFTK